MKLHSHLPMCMAAFRTNSSSCDTMPLAICCNFSHKLFFALASLSRKSFKISDNGSHHWLDGAEVNAIFFKH